MTEGNGTRWVPGQSGNPAGRRPGSGEVARLRAAIAEHVPAIIARLVEQARDGDVQAARLLLERTVPAVKPAEDVAPIAIPLETLGGAGRALLKAGAAGELAPGQVAALLGAVATLGKVVELDELVARIERLEVHR